MAYISLEQLSGDAVISSTGIITISGLALTKLASIADQTILGNVSGASAAPSALSVANVQTMLGLGSAAYTASTAYLAAGATVFNGVTVSGASTPILSVTGTASISGANTGDQTLTGLGGVPTSRTVNGHALTSNVVVTAADLSLATVATSGAYADLTGKPTLGSLAALSSINNSNWSGTALADANIASAATWNAKQAAIAFGTGVLSSLGVNIGSAGAPVLFGGALGTPTSGTLTNCTFPTLNQNTTGTAASFTGALTGDVTSSGMATTISSLAMTKLASIADQTILGNVSGSSAAPSALTAANVATFLGQSTGLGTTASPTFAGLTLTALAALTTPSESWVGPSSTAGIYFKGGNYGFGTAPEYKLSINGAASTPALAIYTNASVNEQYGALRFQYSVGNTGAGSEIRGVNPNTNTSSGDLAFATGNNSGTYNENMRIQGSTGNVGIGTTTPGSKLSVVGLPTSSSGLSAGDIWNNGGVLNIV